MLAPGPPKYPQVLGISLPLGEQFPWNPSSTCGSEPCGTAACLDHRPLGLGVGGLQCVGALLESLLVWCPGPEALEERVVCVILAQGRFKYPTRLVPVSWLLV